jgi:hypothetical protein
MQISNALSKQANNLSPDVAAASDAVHSATVARKHAQQSASGADELRIAAVSGENIVHKCAAVADAFEKIGGKFHRSIRMSHVIPRRQSK